MKTLLTFLVLLSLSGCTALIDRSSFMCWPDPKCPTVEKEKQR